MLTFCRFAMDESLTVDEVATLIAGGQTFTVHYDPLHREYSATKMGVTADEITNLVLFGAAGLAGMVVLIAPAFVERGLRRFNVR